MCGRGRGLSTIWVGSRGPSTKPTPSSTPVFGPSRLVAKLLHAPIRLIPELNIAGCRSEVGKPIARRREQGAWPPTDRSDNEGTGDPYTLGWTLGSWLP